MQLGTGFSSFLKQTVKIDEIYQSASFFMTRSALLPQESFSGLLKDEEFLLTVYQKNPIFQEAVAIASPTLHAALNSLPFLNHKQDERKVYKSILKYYLRMTTRATPFGLFAFVGWGHFDNNTWLVFDIEGVKKQVRPDMEWVGAIAKNCQTSPDLVKKIQVMPNPLITEVHGRISLWRTGNTKEKKELVSIRKTVIVEKALHFAKIPIQYEILEKNLTDFFCQYESEKVSAVLWQLMEKGFLISELSPRIDTSFSFKNFLSAIQKIPIESNLFNSLEEINRELEIYHQTSIGKGIPSLERMLALFSKVHQVDYPLQVDSYFEGKSFTLNSHVQTAIEQAAGILFFLSEDHENFSPLNSYHKTFLEKYGVNRLVSVVDLLDEKRGLGFPVKDSKSPRLQLIQVILQAVSNQSKNREVILDSLICDVKISHEQALKAPRSLELFFEIEASSTKAIDQGDFTLILNSLSGSTQAGSTFGRFLSLWDSTKIKQLTDFLAQEEALNFEVAFIEASFLPQNSRTTNVCFYEKTRLHQLLLHYHEPSSQNIYFEDLYAGATDDRLYLYSKKLKKEVTVLLSSAVNPDLAPEALKFLIDISTARFSSISSFLWTYFHEIPFLPRIRYKNIVISPARWFFNHKILDINDKTPAEMIRKKLMEKFDSYEIPQVVYLTNFDNKIQIDRSHPSEFDLIVDQLIEKKEISLLESNVKNKGGRCAGNGHFYTTEFVTPLVRKVKVEPEYTSKIYSQVSQFTAEERNALPGSEWIYAKIFLPQSEEAFFLIEHVHSMVESLLSHQQIVEWFYIRYKENKPHLRLRLKAKKETIASILHYFCSRLSDLVLQESVSEFSICPYEKEIERYGGLEEMALAEAFFSADSFCSIRLLKISDQKEADLVLFSALSVIHILDHFYEKKEEMIQFLSPKKEDLDFLSGQRQEIHRLAELTKQVFYCDTNDESSSLVIELKEAFRGRKQQLFAFFQRIKNRKLGELYNTKEHIVDSLVHMSCNRILGIDHLLEKKARVLAFSALKRVSYSRNLMLEPFSV